MRIFVQPDWPGIGDKVSRPGGRKGWVDMSDLNTVASIVDDLYEQCQFAVAQNAALQADNARLRRENQRLHQKANKWQEAATSALFALEQLNSAAGGLIKTQAAIIKGEYPYAKDGSLPRREP